MKKILQILQKKKKSSKIQKNMSYYNFFKFACYT